MHYKHSGHEVSAAAWRTLWAHRCTAGAGCPALLHPTNLWGNTVQFNGLSATESEGPRPGEKGYRALVWTSWNWDVPIRITATLFCYQQPEQSTCAWLNSHHKQGSKNAFSSGYREDAFNQTLCTVSHASGKKCTCQASLKTHTWQQQNNHQRNKGIACNTRAAAPLLKRKKHWMKSGSPFHDCLKNSSLYIRWIQKRRKN